MDVLGASTDDSCQRVDDEHDQHVSDNCKGFFISAQRRQHQQVVNDPSQNQYTYADADGLHHAQLRHIGIDHRSATYVVHDDQQQHTAEQGHARCPPKPVELARELVGNLSFLNDVEAAAM